MTRYLLAAEADQIQDFIFRAARLREVVGGSQLLSRFCKEGVPALLAHGGYGTAKPDVIISDGGAFRIAFDTDDDARAFGRDLAELYRRCAGGSLTVADPVEYDLSNFPAASEAAQESLREAKGRGDVAASVAHLPYIAFCASCGLATASAHRKKVERDTADRANYLCANCANKTGERFRQRNTFVREFSKAVRAFLPSNFKRQRLDIPEKGDWTEEISKLDSRRYVAYLVADGNGMGKVFSRCRTDDELKKLSETLTNVLRKSLAYPCAELLMHQESVRERGTLPVLPLILGGDDLFALLPAPWAIDYAARFCRQFEERLQNALKKDAPHLLSDDQSYDLLPRIAAAVVICKGTYPHTLAHKRAEHELTAAKEMARRLEVEQNVRASTLTFAVIIGNEVGGEPSSTDTYRTTLSPYFVEDAVVAAWGINVENLIDGRKKLQQLPGKRRAELKQLYAELETLRPKDAFTLRKHWMPDFNRLLERVGRKEKHLEALENTVASLGDAGQEKNGSWKHLERASDMWYGHGLPDLLEAWDYTFSVDTPLSDYNKGQDDGT